MTQREAAYIVAILRKHQQQCDGPGVVKLDPKNFEKRLLRRVQEVSERLGWEVWGLEDNEVLESVLAGYLATRLMGELGIPESAIPII
jgi:hypothetical protein